MSSVLTIIAQPSWLVTEIGLAWVAGHDDGIGTSGWSLNDWHWWLVNDDGTGIGGWSL